MLKAIPGGCQESNYLFPQFPCNNPATKIISWPDRNEGPYRMCDACADHAIKNRGATVIDLPTEITPLHLILLALGKANYPLEKWNAPAAVEFRKQLVSLGLLSKDEEWATEKGRLVLEKACEAALKVIRVL